MNNNFTMRDAKQAFKDMGFVISTEDCRMMRAEGVQVEVSKCYTKKYIQVYPAGVVGTVTNRKTYNTVEQFVAAMSK